MSWQVGETAAVKEGGNKLWYRNVAIFAAATVLMIVALVLIFEMPRHFILFATIGLTVCWRNFQAWRRSA